MVLSLHPHPERTFRPDLPPTPHHLACKWASWLTRKWLQDESQRPSRDPRSSFSLGYCSGLSEPVSLFRGQLSSGNLFLEITFPSLCGSQGFDNHLVKRPSTLPLHRVSELPARARPLVRWKARDEPWWARWSGASLNIFSQPPPH
jgi:hypothetical protein